MSLSDQQRTDTKNWYMASKRFVKRYKETLGFSDDDMTALLASVVSFPPEKKPPGGEEFARDFKNWTQDTEVLVADLHQTSDQPEEDVRGALVEMLMADRDIA